MVRALTERLPVMVCPRWVMTRTQPIGVRDVLRYLVDTLEVPGSAGRVIEIGGADVLTYREMMLKYADVRGLTRRLIVVPVLTPRLSSYWVGLVTPIPLDVAAPLVEGLRTEVVVTDDTARRLFGFSPMGYETALRLALARTSAGEVESAWHGAGGPAVEPRPARDQGVVADQDSVHVDAPPETVYAAAASLGGQTGWRYADRLWAARGLLDRLVGGPGLRRGRRDPHALRVGDALDFWRVERVEPPRLIVLRAEMRLPGRAWLEVEVEPEGSGSRLTMSGIFEPKGLGGYTYWYGLYPAHRMIFAGLVREVAREAERTARTEAVAGRG
jgi:uncharacterized protein YndB with AHSA1/START domain